MSFFIHQTCFVAVLCILIKGGVVWCNCSMNRMRIQDANFTLTNGLNEGSILQYQCRMGYYASPELAYRCNLNHRWTPEPESKPRCRRVECPDPTVLQNGFTLPVYEKKKYYFQSKITYHCYSGYTLHGPSRRSCLENGKWSGPNPVCRQESGDCPDPGVPPGGMRFGNSFEIGDKVIFKCNSDMILIGSEERECQIDGQWSGTETACYYKYTYDSPWEVTEVFGSGIKNSLTSNLVNETQKGLSLTLTRDGTLNIFIALDVSESISEEHFKNATKAIYTLIKKIEVFSVYPNYEVIFFSSKIHTAINILDFYGPTKPSMITLLERFEKYKLEETDKFGTDINAVLIKILEKMSAIKTRASDFSEHMHVIILFTDGGYNTGGAPTVEKIKSLVYMDQPEKRQKYLDIYVFAIGAQIHDENLKPLTVGTGKTHYYRLSAVEDLQQTFDEMIDESDVMGLCGLTQDYGNLEGQGIRKMYPWVIPFTVLTMDGKSSSCLGSLVSDHFILTAAHCFKNKSSSSVTVGGKGYPALEVDQIHIHPNYNLNAKMDQNVKEFYDYDVALIELAAKVPITISLRPICFPCTAETNAALRQNLTCKEQENLLLRNHERVTFLTKKFQKKEARLKLGEHRHECIMKAMMNPNIPQNINVTEVVTENFLCTGGRKPYVDKIACKGDSGSAVFKNYESRTFQVALVSWGTKEVDDCKNDRVAVSDDDSRDFHINLFKVVPFLKSVLRNEIFVD